MFSGQSGRMLGALSVAYSLETAQEETGRQKMNLVLLLWETKSLIMTSQFTEVDLI